MRMAGASTRLRPLLLALLAVSGCSASREKRLADFGTEFILIVSADNAGVFFWRLSLDPPHDRDLDEGVLELWAPDDTDLGRVVSRKFPTGSCRVEARLASGGFFLHALPDIEDDDFHLSGKIERNRANGRILHAGIGGVRVLGGFGCLLERKP